jgi:hypothetical protein
MIIGQKGPGDLTGASGTGVAGHPPCRVVPGRAELAAQSPHRGDDRGAALRESRDYG